MRALPAGPLLPALAAAIVASGAAAAGAGAAAWVADPPAAAVRVVDGFEDASEWEPRPADGVELAVHPDSGVRGRALRLDFRFVKGGGYAVIHRKVALALPKDYRFRFRVRGRCGPQNLEFKLMDPSGENVWWVNRRDYHFPERWDTVAVKKRHIQFAWGPARGVEMRRVAAIEFAVTAGSGGEGSVWLDELELEPLPPPGAALPAPTARASSARGGQGPGRALDGDARTAWASAPGDARPWLALDFGAAREYGGLVIHWESGRHAADYAVEVSDDGVAWRRVREVRGGNGGRDDLYLPETESRRLRLRALRSGTPAGVAVREMEVKPLEWAASLEDFFEAIAKDAPRGSYPRGIVGEQPYWTVVGADGDEHEGLLSEDGLLETGRGSFSVEPFLFAGGRLFTWSDGGNRQWLEEGQLPIPSVGWRRGDLGLTVTAFATGEPGASSVVARYRVTNLGPRRAQATLFLALRPFQVNPPTQFLNIPGGAAPIRTIAAEGRLIRVNGDRGVVSLTEPSGFGAAAFDHGDITEFLRDGRLPPRRAVSDPFEHASGALAYRLDLAPGAAREVDLLVPLRGWPDAARLPMSDVAARELVEEQLGACRRGWRERLERVTIELPDTAVVRTLRAQLGWILVNRDGPAIQPGSRSYERSWIRDGSLTSSALLRLGHPEAVRAFLEWFAGYQYDNGKVPCCVDRRGADPVPEHDSSGEFIYLVAEHYRYTGDRALAERMWPAVARAAAYLDSLRRLRRTHEWRAPGTRHFFGLLPPSISHEGYSAKPMHSYWDDFFALRGFKDAAFLARSLRREADATRLAAVRGEFQRDLVASIGAAMRRHRIDYIPGSADLGDFDATSTTIALAPGGALGALPRAAVEHTFEKYWEFFRDRRDGRADWRAFTPYEVRHIGAFVRLGWRDRANELLRFFMNCRRPPGWAQWAEVVGREERAATFIGDMPHTWVGSDFVRSVLDLLSHEREEDESLVLGAGVPWEWLARPPGVAVRGLRTPHGTLSCTMRAMGDAVEVRIESGLRVPRGGIVVNPPAARGFREAMVNAAPAPLTKEGAVVVRELPATVLLRP